MTLQKGQTFATHPPSTIWVIGGGQFGRRAVELLKKDSPAGNIIMVDREPSPDLPHDIEIVRADGVAWFAEHFTPEADVHKIIPALPLHLAADWLKIKLANVHRIVSSSEIPDEQLRLFPHPIRLSPSRVVMSHADFLCPANCSEPDDICTFTRKPRPPSLYSILETMDWDNFVPLIIKKPSVSFRSRRFFPGRFMGPP